MQKHGPELSQIRSIASSQNRKMRLVVLYGGRSSEHEVSLRSGASVVRYLDSQLFEVIPVGIGKNGRWRLLPREAYDSHASSLPIEDRFPEVILPPRPTENGVGRLLRLDEVQSEIEFDAVFPVLHGPLCEDGTLQGLLELAEVPYVGCGVLASAVGMDKEVAKRLARDAGLPIVPFIALQAESIERQGDDALREQVARELGFPVFVKPANMGSSVGVHKVREASALLAAIKDALRYDRKVLIERSVNAREIEVSALESARFGGVPRVSVPGEIAPSHEFYSYESKYLDENGASLMIPAQLSAEQVDAIQGLARDVFVALQCEGLARVDLFLDKDSGSFYLNEINTLPGFTSISMYPKMWEATGLKYTDLLTELVELALLRRKRRDAIKTDRDA